MSEQSIAMKATIPQTLVEELCRCLAFHAYESELTSKFMVPTSIELEGAVTEAKRLIGAAGFDFDVLLELSERTIAIDPNDDAKSGWGRSQ